MTIQIFISILSSQKVNFFVLCKFVYPKERAQKEEQAKFINKKSGISLKNLTRTET